MAICKYCGHEYSCYTDIDGRRIPYGCNCRYRDSAANEEGIAIDEGRAPRFDPFDQGPVTITRPLTHWGECPFCGDSVVWHTNGFGDWVLLERPYPPWDVHPCWKDAQDAKRAVGLARTWRDRTGYNVRLLTAPGVELGLLAANNAGYTYHFQAGPDIPVAHWNYAGFTQPRPPIKPRAVGERRLIVSRVRCRCGNVPAERGMPLLALETESGTEVFMPPRIGLHLRTGDPLLCEVEAFYVNSLLRWIVRWIRMPDGMTVDNPISSQKPRHATGAAHSNRRRTMTDDHDNALISMALVTRACLEHGVKFDETYILRDPGDTFVATMSASWVNVLAFNNEDQGMSRLLVDRRDGEPDVVIYEPGPWELRVRNLLSS